MRKEQITLKIEIEKLIHHSKEWLDQLIHFDELGLWMKEHEFPYDGKVLGKDIRYTPKGVEGDEIVFQVDFIVNDTINKK